jgi:glycosyltransferase involved in cell wall biosynthesis
MGDAVQQLNCVNNIIDKPKLTDESVGLDFATSTEIDGDLLHRLEEISDDAEFEAEMRIFESSRPADTNLWHVRVRRQIRLNDHEAAIALIDNHQFDESPDESGLLEKAELLHDARDYERAYEIFDGLIERHPGSVSIIMAYAKRLLPLGHLVRARNLLLPFADVFPEGNWRRLLVDKTLSLFALLSRLEGTPLQEDQDARILAMKHMILHFRDRELPVRDSLGLGRLTLITGSLGPGGAERQLSRLAIELERARKKDGEIAGVQLDRPVEVLVRSHGPEKQNDFYLDEVRASGCELGQINLFKPLSNKALGVDDPVLLTLIDYLPSPVNFGVRRLTRHFQESGTETASIWQDGACLFGGLAALMAGVPNIQLAMRGLPPSMRRHLYRPEYEVLYRAIAEVPGVSFVSNNLSAARAYAEWLDFPVNRFGIIYNGVEPMRAEPSPECAELWDKFVETTADAEHTIGGVFRFDTDKQPLLWIRFAARYLKRHPASRFILVGGGRLLPNAQELAEKLGISDRILFVGRSTRVGYWMSKMDVLVLMSRYEGLPNVLIEAQYMGVRAVTTPAGGAAECLIDGTTGYVLECAEKPNLEHAVERVRSLALRSDDRDLFAEGGVGRAFLDSHFSIPRMLEEYVTYTVEHLRALDRESDAEDRRQVA